MVVIELLTQMRWEVEVAVLPFTIQPIHLQDQLQQVAVQVGMEVLHPKLEELEQSLLKIVLKQMGH
jgi:hypothetical protein